MSEQPLRQRVVIVSRTLLSCVSAFCAARQSVRSSLAVSMCNLSRCACLVARYTEFMQLSIWSIARKKGLTPPSFLCASNSAHATDPQATE